MKEYTDQQIIALAEPLFKAMRSRVSDEEMEMMHRAFELAREAHAPQRRKSGEPYIIHPIAVARIVGEELELGAHPVCAAFLHDVVEDTPYTIEDIRRMFGDDIAFLVGVVTKTKKEFYENSKQVDNFKQMLDSVKYDIRALLVKLADRLHNMRTLASMRPDKQMKIAGETDYFYAPLANRLGLYKVKTELENLSFRYRCPREYALLDEMLEKEKMNIRPYLENFTSIVREALDHIGISADVDIVTRKPYSINRKTVSTNSDFYHLEGMHCISIVYDTPEWMTEKHAALAIYAALSDRLEERPHSLSNYIDHPKENGYQSLHVHFLADNGHWQEVHISSRRMARVQQLGVIADMNDSNISGWIGKLRSTLQEIAQSTHEVSFMDGVVSSFYKDDITVYTPDGMAVVLPAGASAIDFAFEIHTNIGLHAKFAKINGKLQSVKTKLKRGDLVLIGVDPRVNPTRDWLEHAVTFKAKRQIKLWLSGLPVNKMIRCRHCHPLPGDEVIGFRRDDNYIDVHKRDCSIAISRASQEGDSVVAVDFAPDNTMYGVRVTISAVERDGLIGDLVGAIKNLSLPIDFVSSESSDYIVNAEIGFSVRSFHDLSSVITSLSAIDGVDEVKHKEF